MTSRPESDAQSATSVRDNERALRLVGRVSTLLTSLFVLAIAVVIPLVSRSFRAMFEDLESPLPIVTSAVLAIPAMAWILGGIAIVALLVLLDRTLRPMLALAIDGIVAMLALAFLLGLVWVFFLPLIEILESIE